VSTVSTRYLKPKANKKAPRPFGTFPRGFSDDGEFIWPLVSAGKLVELNYGKSLVDSKRTPGPIAVYGTNGPCGWHNESLVKGPGVILGRKGMGPLGVEWCEKDFWVIDTAYFVTPKTPDLDLRFFYHLTKYIGLNHLKDGTSNPSLSRDTFYAQLYPQPPLPEQRAIASVLGALDDKIELNRRMNETLEALTQSLFKTWFVDAGRGGLPKGWRQSTIGEEVRVVGGSTPSTSKPEFWEGGTNHWATPKDLAPLTSPMLLDTERRITDAGVRQISSGLLPAGTVLLSSRAPIGYLAIAEVPVAVNQGFIAMVCDKELPNHYVRLWAKENMELIEANANGTTFLEISKGNFRPLPVLVPPKRLMDAFQRQVEPLHECVVSNLHESRTLAALRDALLPKLLSGELRVPPQMFRQAGVAA
jgi:type I restriction enzyme S subunit